MVAGYVYKITNLVNGKKYPTRSQKVKCVETGSIFDSYMEANVWLGVDRSSNKIRLCAEGLKPQYKGFHWEKVADKLRVSSDVQV